MRGKHAVKIVLVEHGKKYFITAPLKFDNHGGAFATIGKGRLALDPIYLERLEAPLDGADYSYRLEIPAPESEESG